MPTFDGREQYEANRRAREVALKAGPKRRAAVERQARASERRAGLKRPGRQPRVYADVPRQVFERMRHVVGVACELNEWGAGTEGYGLLCTLARCVGRWPRVRAGTFDEVARRFGRLMAEIESGG